MIGSGNLNKNSPNQFSLIIIPTMSDLNWIPRWVVVHKRDRVIMIPFLRTLRSSSASVGLLFKMFQINVIPYELF